MFFFFEVTAATETYPLSLHDALPISTANTASPASNQGRPRAPATSRKTPRVTIPSRIAWIEPCRKPDIDRKSTRLNSSHRTISYAVFCLKKKKTTKQAIHGPHPPHST